MSEAGKSEQACPVCGRHALALDQPPHIDIMGAQAYSDMLGMGDLPQVGAVGIVCLDCGTRWRDKAAFDRHEPEPEDRGAAIESGGGWDDEGGPEAEPST
jgi:hypothetical protein